MAETNGSTNRLSQIIKIQAKLTEANFDLDKFMNLVVKQMQKLTPATGVVIELVEGQEMVYRAATGTVKSYLGLRLNVNNSISGLCIKTKKILIAKDTEHDKRVNLEACRKVGARSLVVAPLFYEGKAIGVIKIMSTSADAFGPIDVKSLQLMAGLIASALAHQIIFEERNQAFLELKEAQKQLEYLAYHDPLTGLPNRKLFENTFNLTMKRTERNKKLMALMFLDVDHFKTINDTLGHDVGDALLKTFSQRLKKCVRVYDFIGRIGGDEFILLIDQLKNKESATEIAGKIVVAMKKPFQLDQHLVQISTSIGVAFYKGEDLPPTELVKRADLALYEAKEAGRSQFKVYD